MMSEETAKPILAIITTSRDQVGGGAPIFYCQTSEEQQQIAFTLERCLDATIHEISPSVLILVKH